MIKGLIALGLVGVSVYVGLFFLLAQKKDSEAVVGLVQSANIEANVIPVVSQSAGRVAYIDPVTGELTSTPPVGSENLNVSASVNLPPVEMVTHSNGTVQAKLNGRFRLPLVATIGCDGQIEMEHTEESSASAKECEAE